MKASLTLFSILLCPLIASCQNSGGLQLTKADPSRYLPEGTSIDDLQKKNRASELASKREKKEPILLAKNTKTSSRPTLSDLTKTQPEEEVSPIELPPLPEASETDDQFFGGILPALDGSNEAPFIDVPGETPELPPLELEIDEDNDIAP